MVMLAICDAQYLFTIVEIGAYGSNSDGGILLDSQLGDQLESNALNIPSDAPIRGYSNRQNFPYFFVADAAFPLGKHILRPYPGHLLPLEKEHFNNRLSRARRVIENSFGILSARWRILLQTINAEPDMVENIIKACVCLHNFLRVKSPTYCPPGFSDCDDLDNGQWRKNAGKHILQSVGHSTYRNSTHRALKLRDEIAFYLSGEGKINQTHQ